MAEEENREEQQEEQDKEQARKHVDEEWKKQVAEEKEEARREEGRGAGGRREMPEASFQVFMAGLYTQTLMALGQMENPVSGEKKASLPEAQYLIDTIDMLKEKTTGNLTEQESGYLENLLYDLRMRYIEASKESDRGEQEEEEESDEGE